MFNIKSNLLQRKPRKRIFTKWNLKKEEIFQKQEFWFDLTSYYIQSNYHEQIKNTISCIEELDEEDTMKIKSITFGKSSAILYNMKNFSVDLNQSKNYLSNCVNNLILEFILI